MPTLFQQVIIYFLTSYSPRLVRKYFDMLTTAYALPRRTWSMNHPLFFRVNALIKNADELFIHLNSVPLSSVIIGTFFCLESFLVKKACFMSIWMQLGFLKLSVLVLWTNLLILGPLPRKWLNRYASVID